MKTELQILDDQVGDYPRKSKKGRVSRPVEQRIPEFCRHGHLLEGRVDRVRVRAQMHRGRRREFWVCKECELSKVQQVRSTSRLVKIIDYLKSKGVADPGMHAVAILDLIYVRRTRSRTKTKSIL